MAEVRVTTIEELSTHLLPHRNGLIGLDGYQGAGKSTVAKEVSELLGLPLIHLDDFLEPGRGGYLDFVRYPEVATALLPRPLIVEGVCLLAVMQRLEIKADCHVYIASPVPDRRTPRGRGPVASEVAQYHREFRPADVADILYLPTSLADGVTPMEASRTAVDVAFIQAKTKLALALAIGGMLTLLIGLAVLLYGVSGQDHTLLKVIGLELSASGLGGVIMATSVVWAFLAYRARPTYGRSYETSEEYDAEARLVRRHERETSTIERARGSDAT